MAKKKSDTSNWLDDAVEVPRIQVKGNRDRAKWQRFYRWVILASVFLLPLSLGLNVLNSARPATKSNGSAAAQVDTRARATAALSLAAWLSSDPSPVYGKGVLLSWDGQSEVAQPKKFTDKAGKEITPGTKYSILMQQFTIADSLGELFQVQVPVAVDKTYGAKVISTPSLMQVPAADNDGFSGEMQTASPWPGITSSPAPSEVVSAINTWTSKFAGGNSSSLRMAVQDKSANHTYQTLTNVASATVSVGKAAYLFTDPAVQYSAAGKKSATMIAQVQLKLIWQTAPTQPGEAPVAQPDPSQVQNWPTVTYDLLIQNANTAAPIVVAWGSPGSGPTLKAYQNALVGVKDVAAPKPTSAPG